MPKFSTLVRFIFASYLLLVVYLLVAKPTGKIPSFDFSFWIIPDDKVKHVLLFIPYMLLNYFAAFKKPFLVLFFIGIFVCSMAESIHYFLPYREFSIYDFLANSVGLSIGSVLFLLRKN